MKFYFEIGGTIWVFMVILYTSSAHLIPNLLMEFRFHYTL